MRFSKAVLIAVIVLGITASSEAGFRRNSQTRAIDYTGVDILATDCSSYVIEGYLCYDTDDDILYIGDGAAVSQVGGGSANTLDDAYDGGGSGAGRTITADQGPVEITGGIVATDATFTNILSTDATFTNIGRTTPGDATFNVINADSNLNLGSSGYRINLLTDTSGTYATFSHIATTSSGDTTFTNISASSATFNALNSTRIGNVIPKDATFSTVSVSDVTFSSVAGTPLCYSEPNGAGNGIILCECGSCA